MTDNFFGSSFLEPEVVLFLPVVRGAAISLAHALRLSTDNESWKNTIYSSTVTTKGWKVK